MRAAIAQWVKASGQLPLESGWVMGAMRDGGKEAFTDLRSRPWKWLAAAAEQDLDAGDPRTACLASWFSFSFNKMKAPQMNLGDFLALDLDAAPPELQARIARLGHRAAGMLPPEEIVAGQPGDALTAGMVRELTESQLAGSGGT